jgi:hypothetical protein
MGSSKVVLIGAVSVVFGLYSLSISKVGTYVGSTAEIAFYLAKAEDNAKSGVHRAVNLASRNWGYSGLYPYGYYTSAETFNLTDPDSRSEGYFNYSVTLNKALFSGSTGYVMTIVSRGVYKAPGEPSAFAGHEAIRTATAIFDYIDRDPGSGVWLDVKLQSVFTAVNYTRERQLDSLQQSKDNLVGY